MKYGILLTSIYGAETDARVQRREHAELVTAADQLGFDIAFAGQHFLGAELRYFQPVPWLTYMSQFSARMQFATGIILLSIVNPIDMAEQMATLDVLTDGRAVFGVGLGYSPHEFDAFRVERGTKVARFEEGLELIRRLWSGDQVDFEGRFYTVRGARPSVLPLQPGGPPIWLGGQAAGAIKRAARMADAWYCPPFPSHAELRTLRELFLQTRLEAGQPVDGDFPVRRELIVADSRGAAVEAALVRFRARYETYRKWGLSGENTPIEGAGDKLRDDIESQFILGTPQDCAEQIAKLREDTGMTHFVYKAHWPGMPHADAMRALERFGTEVMPLVG